MAPGLIGKSSKGLLYWACSSESKKRGRDQDKRESSEEKACREGEKEEKIGIFPTTLEQSTSRGCHSFGEYWRILDYGIQIQRDYPRR